MANRESADLSINMERLKADIERFAGIGRGDDGGVYRTAFSEADWEARLALHAALEACGLATTIDGAGNVLGRLGPDSDCASLLIGSHLDSVPAGGRLDGTLGVLCGLECLRRLKEVNAKLVRPVELAAFSDEEGRFGSMFGSRAMAGELNPDLIATTSDLSGLPLTSAMEARGLDPIKALMARRSADSIYAFIELHIEQGPVLDSLGKPLGVVRGITGLFKWGIRLKGEPDHAGTTPMPMRRDAFAGLAEFAGEIPRVLEEHGSEHSVATIGRVALQPGIANTVPALAEFTLDVRDGDPAVLAALGDAFRTVLSAIARRRHLMFEFDILGEITPIVCDARIIDVLAESAREERIDPHFMTSGAAHDTQIMAKLAPAGMLFVPSVGGRSHCPAEWTHWEDIEAGANVLLRSVLRFAQED